MSSYKLLLCLYCKDLFKFWQDLSLHLKIVHKIEYKNYLKNSLFLPIKFYNKIENYKTFPTYLLSPHLNNDLLNMTCIQAYNFVDNIVNHNREYSIFRCSSTRSAGADYLTQCLNIFFNYIYFDIVEKKLQFFEDLTYDFKIAMLIHSMISDSSFCMYFHNCHNKILNTLINYICQPPNSRKIKFDKIKYWFIQQIVVCIKKNIQIIMILFCQTNMYPCKHIQVLNNFGALLKCMRQEILEKSYPGYQNAKTFLKRLRHSLH